LTDCFSDASGRKKYGQRRVSSIGGNEKGRRYGGDDANGGN